MKNIYKVIFLLILLTTISTYTPKNLKSSSKSENSFFKIKKIEVKNTKLVNKNFIIEKLEKIYNKNIFTINKDNISKSLMTIDFLERVNVKKKYPNTILVEVFETYPIAILIKNEKKFFLDNSSNLIAFNKEVNSNLDLPSIFGESAENYFLEFLKKLKDNNFPYEKIKNYYYYQVGRWDLQLLDDKIIKLPDNKIILAIIKSNKLLIDEEFKKYKIIDLRINDKIIVE